MPTSTRSRLFLSLLSIVIRLYRSFEHIALTLRARFTSFWRSILNFARHRRQRGGQSQIRFHANDVPVVDNNPKGERLQISKREKVEEEDRAALAARAMQPVRWEDAFSRYQDPTSSQFKFNALPVIPERGSRRYKPRRASPGLRPHSSILAAGQQKLLTALPQLPEGWRRHVHPEGNISFYHEGLHIFTESDVIRNEKEILFNATKLVQEAIQKKADVILDESTEIVLNVDGKQWYYYFVDHTHRLLFWVHPVKMREDLGTDLQRITGYSHIRYLVETRYWYAFSGLSGMSCIVYDMKSRSHCEYYPHNHTLPKEVMEELRGMLSYAKTDMMTAHSSTSPFAQDEVVAILGLVNSFKDGDISNPYSIWVIARLMVFFTENQFLNFCGQPCARLNADASLFGQQNWNCGIVFTFANVVLLWSLNEHAIRLKRVWVDGIVIQPRWKDFINRLTTELARYTIFSTVMLAVDVSFLAVPGVVSQGSSASSIQIIIYCSLVSTVASIVFSLALLNVYNDPELMDANPAAEVMWTLTGQKNLKWGMTCFAITHSLPNACLKWLIVLFSTALAAQIFGSKELPTLTTLSIECFILMSFGFMSFQVMWLLSKKGGIGDVDVSAENDPPLSLGPV